MNHMEQMDFLKAVKADLKKRKLSIAWAASQLGMTAGHLGQVLNGHVNLTDDVRHNLEALKSRVQSFQEVQAV